MAEPIEKECSVCAEKYNKTTRKMVHCNFCNYQSCRDCVKKYLMGSINEACCMSCKVPWNHDFIWDNFPHTFYNNEYLQHRANILFEREKALLPETQHRLYCDKLRHELYPLEDMVFFYSTEKNEPAYVDEVRKRIIEIRDVIGLQRGGGRVGLGSFSNVPIKKDVVVRGCPVDTCKGFIMKSNFQCGMCRIKLCRDCHQVISKDTSHECVKEDVETAKLLTHNTKPCPTCREMIYKIDGCSQMWCVFCHTAFCWNTGEIQKKIHNPHYYEWLRRSGQTVPREDGDIPHNPCENHGGLAGDVRADVRLIRNARFSNENLDIQNARRDILYAIHRGIGHIQFGELPRIVRNIEHENSQYMFENLRVDYLQNAITEDEWKKRLGNTQKRNEKWCAVREVLELYIRVLNEQINSLITSNEITDEAYDTAMSVIAGIREYCNELLQKMKTKYNMTPFYIHEGIYTSRITPKKKKSAPVPDPAQETATETATE